MRSRLQRYGGPVELHKFMFHLCNSTGPPYLCKRDLIPHLHHTNVCNVPYYI
jgi:hypothetical protein